MSARQTPLKKAGKTSATLRTDHSGTGREPPFLEPMLAPCAAGAGGAPSSHQPGAEATCAPAAGGELADARPPCWQELTLAGLLRKIVWQLLSKPKHARPFRRSVSPSRNLPTATLGACEQNLVHEGTVQTAREGKVTNGLTAALRGLLPPRETLK